MATCQDDNKMVYQFQYDQDRPDLLCRDRQHQTPELHESNDFYGQASVLKRYAGLPPDYALKAVLEHGLFLRDTLWDYDQQSPLPMNLAASDYRAAIFRAATAKPTVTIGFGYLYAMRLVERTPVRVDRRVGTLVFPCHSSHFVKCQFDHAEYADRLAALPASMRPVVVCAYWLDYLAGNYDAYERRGFPIVTAGHLYDTEFQLRLHDLCRRFRFAVSNNIGTHLFASVASGCRFLFVDSGDLRFELPPDEAVRLGEGRNRLLETKRRARELFRSESRASSAEQQEFVDGILGAAHVRTPSAMRALLLRADLADRFAAFRRRQEARVRRIGRSIHKRLPWEAWRRSA